jgi:protease I
MRLEGKKIGVLIESDFYEPEIFYYQRRFPEEGAELVFMSRLWGQDALTFDGHEFRAPFYCDTSFEGLSDDDLRSFDALIVPSGMVSDRLRYSPDPMNDVAPAATLLARAFAEKSVLKGIICHGMWLASPVSHVVKGRKAVVHNNLYGDAQNMGINYVNEDVVVDGDLVTGREGGVCHLFARKIIDVLAGDAS